MKTMNIRWIMLMMALAMTTGLSAQKNVLKAFDEVKRDKGVVVEKVIIKKDDTPFTLYDYNYMELSIPKKSDVAKYMSKLYKAFVKDSENKNTTFYREIPPLGYNATSEDKVSRQKISVQYVSHLPPVVIGEDPSYETIILRSRVKNPTKRMVVCMEFKRRGTEGMSLKLYEIMGDNFNLVEENISVLDERHEFPQPQPRKDDIVTRMHFYRDNFNGEDNSDNSALLLNMTEYLDINWEKASESEQNMVMLILQDMASRSKAKMHRDLISQRVNSLKTSKEVIVMGTNVKQRIALYQKDYLATTSQLQRSDILDNLKSYVESLKKMEFDGRTINDVYDELISFKKKVNSQLQLSNLTDIIRTFLNNSQETMREENPIVMGANVKQRIALYQKDYLATTSQLQRSQILDNLKSYVVSLEKKDLDGRTINDVYEELILFKKKVTSQLHQSTINDMISILSK